MVIKSGQLLPHLNSHFAVPFRVELRMQEAGATVPAQNCVVISGWANALGLLIRMHSFFEQNGDGVGRASGLELGLGTALMQQAAVIELFVSVGQLPECFYSSRVRI